MFNVKNFAKSKVLTGYDAAATSITVSSGTDLPTAPFYAVWWNSTDYAMPDDDPYREIIYVGSRVGSVLSAIERGKESTTAVAHNTSNKDYYIHAVLTAGMVDQLRGCALFGTSAPTTTPDDPDTVYTYWNLTDRSLWIWDTLTAAWAKVLGLILFLLCFLSLQGMAQPSYQRNEYTTNVYPPNPVPLSAMHQLYASNKPVRLWVQGDSLTWNVGSNTLVFDYHTRSRGIGYLYHLTNSFMRDIYAVSNYAFDGKYVTNMYVDTTNWIKPKLNTNTYTEVVLIEAGANDTGMTAGNFAWCLTNMYNACTTNGALVIGQTITYQGLYGRPGGDKFLVAANTNIDAFNAVILGATNIAVIADINQLVDPFWISDHGSPYAHFTEGGYYIWAEHIAKAIGLAFYKTRPIHYYSNVRVRHTVSEPFGNFPDGTLNVTYTGEFYIRTNGAWLKR